MPKFLRVRVGIFSGKAAVKACGYESETVSLDSIVFEKDFRNQLEIDIARKVSSLNIPKSKFSLYLISLGLF